MATTLVLALTLATYASLVSQCVGMDLDSRIGETKEVNIDIVSQRVNYPKSASGAEFYEPPSDNHLFKLEKVNGLFMIIPKVRQVALDANGCKGPVYFHDTPDTNNPNHLWEVQDVGGFKRIVSAVVIRE